MFQKLISREDLRRNPKVLYVFGDNVRRFGFGGQARAMRDEPNGIGVATKYTPHVYFSEGPAETIAQKRVIDEDMRPLFDHVKAGGTVVWPADGIGTGLASLPQRAPSTFTYLEEKLAALLEAARAYAN